MRGGDSHFPITCEQYPCILKLLYLAWQLTPNPEGAIHRFPSQNHSLRLGGADSHPSHFVFCSKRPQIDEANRTTSPAKKQRHHSEVPKLDTLLFLATPLEPFHKYYKQDQKQGQPLRGPTTTENMFGFVLRRQKQLPCWSNRDQVAHSNVPGYPYSPNIHKAQVYWISKLP